MLRRSADEEDASGRDSTTTDSSGFGTVNPGFRKSRALFVGRKYLPI